VQGIAVDLRQMAAESPQSTARIMDTLHRLFAPYDGDEAVSHRQHQCRLLELLADMPVAGSSPGPEPALLRNCLGVYGVCLRDAAA
jgi:hypothetical protein